jgi:hypothetical protein
MEILKDIPAQTSITHEIRIIAINLELRKAYVDVTPKGVPGKNIEVDIAPIIAAATTTQKNTIKGFIKKIIAAAMEIDEATVPAVLEP